MEDKKKKSNNEAAEENTNNKNGDNVAVMDQISNWMVAAFFTSLERFACVNLSTADCDDDDDRPVYLTEVDDLDIDLDDLEVPV